MSAVGNLEEDAVLLALDLALYVRVTSAREGRYHEGHDGRVRAL